MNTARVRRTKKKLYIEIKKYNLTQQNNLRVCVYLLCGLYATPRSAAAATNYSFTEIDELDVWEHKITKKKYFCAYNKRGLSPFYWVLLLLLYKNDIQHKHICVSVCVCPFVFQSKFITCNCTPEVKHIYAADTTNTKVISIRNILLLVVPCWVQSKIFFFICHKYY